MKDKYNKYHLFLIDTGATTSVLSVSDTSKFNLLPNSSIIVQGLSGTINTVGRVREKFYFGKLRFSHEFHVFLKDETNLSIDGILGNDFLRRFEANLNYDDLDYNIEGYF